MSRTYRHTKPEFVYGTDDNGRLSPENWQEAKKHYDSYGGWRLLEKRNRNRRIRHDRGFLHEFDNYTMPKDRIGWWD